MTENQDEASTAKNGNVRERSLTRSHIQFGSARTNATKESDERDTPALLQLQRRESTTRRFMSKSYVPGVYKLKTVQNEPKWLASIRGRAPGLELQEAE